MSWLRVWEGSNVTELGCCLNKILYFIFCLCCQIVVKMDICTHKRLNLLKVDDIFTCQCMSFYYKYVNKNVPLYYVNREVKIDDVYGKRVREVYATHTRNRRRFLAKIVRAT